MSFLTLEFAILFLKVLNRDFPLIVKSLNVIEMSKGSFMQTKYLCVLIHIWIMGEVGAVKPFKPSSKIFYWSFQGGTSFVDLLCFICLLFAMHVCASVYMCFVVNYWERADLLALVCGVCLWVWHFPIGILGQVRYSMVSIPDLCTLTYFYAKLCVKLQWTALFSV